MDLRDKATLVTGASRGLGKELARALARRGARVVMVARDKGPLHEAARSLRDEGGEVHVLVSDIGEKTAILPLAGAAASLVGPIDILVHNASTLGPTPLRGLLDTDCEDFERALAVNLVGPFRLSKAVAGSMALRGSGLIVHVTSDASVNAYPTWGAYGVSKAAFDHLARSFAAELGDRGVRVISVDPGEMNTRMHAEAMPDADPATLVDPAVVAARIVSRMAEIESVPNGARLEVMS